MTARTLIADALGACGQFGQDDEPSAADFALGVRELQRLLDSWSNDNLQIWTTVDATVTTAGGDADYSTNEWSDTRVPVTIQNVWLRDDSIDFPLYEITEAEYDAIPAKSTEGLPEAYFWKRVVHEDENSDPTLNELRGTLYLYPTPDKAYGLKIQSRLTLATAVTLDSVIVAPPGYEHMFVRNLAVAMCDYFGIDPKPGLVNSAMLARKAVTPANHRAPRLATGLPGSGYTTPSYVRILGDT